MQVAIAPFRVGDQAGAVVSYEDITSRRRAQDELVDTEGALERAQAMARAGSWTADFTAETFTPSRFGAQLLGWTPGPHGFAELFALIHPDDDERQMRAWTEAVVSRTPFDCELRMRLAGEWRWVRVRAEFTYAADGRPLRGFGVTQDITDQRLMHDAVAREQARLRTLLDTIPDIVFLKDAEGRYRLGNPAIERLLHVPHATFIDRTDFDVFPPEAAEAYRRDDLAVMESGLPIRREETVPDAATGRLITLDTVKAPVYHEGVLIGVVGISRDMTEQRRIDAALAESERAQQFALDAAQLGTWHHIPGSSRIRLDERARALWDVDDPVVDLVDLLATRVHPDDVSRLTGPAGPTAAGRHTLEFRVRWRDGQLRWLRTHVQLSFTGLADAPVDLESHGTIQDITERRRDEETITRLLAASPSVIYALEVRADNSFPLGWVSPNLERMTGWSVEESNQTRWWIDNIHPDDRAAVVASHAAMMRQGASTREFRFRRRDGTYLWVRDEQRVVNDASGRPAEIVGSWSDVSGRIVLEDQLRQAHKLEGDRPARGWCRARLQQPAHGHRRQRRPVAAAGLGQRCRGAPAVGRP